MRVHFVMLHGQEDSVDDDADGDRQLRKGVSHHDSQGFLNAQPPGAAAPYKVFGGQVFSTLEARLL